MPYELALSALDQLPATTRVTFIGGEPCLWLLRYPDILHRAVESGRPLGMVTNGILVPKLPELVGAFRNRVISMQISIDGYEKTYEEIRVRSSWEKLVTAIRLIQSTRREAGNRQAHLNVNYLLMRRTLADLPEFVRFCAREGIDEVRLTYTMIYDYMVRLGTITEDESVYHHRDETNEAIGEAIEVALQEGIALRYPPPIGRPEIRGEQYVGPVGAGRGKRPGAPPPRVPCEKPWTSLQIYQDGTVRPCCCGKQGPVVGHVQDGIETIWNGPLMQEVRDAMVNGGMHRSCGCGINIRGVANQAGEEHFFTRVRDEKRRAAAAKPAADCTL
jgi:MoaA/NifB/PqqE/SkfB family radical SAM enzyme